jgi:hypothetical protein
VFGFFNLSEFVEVCFPGQRELGKRFGRKNISYYQNSLALLKLAGPFQESFSCIQLDRQESLYKVFEIDLFTHFV